MSPRQFAEAVVNSDGPIRVFASCEWDELGSDGQEWLTAIIVEAVERSAKIADDDTPGGDTGRDAAHEAIAGVRIAEQIRAQIGIAPPVVAEIVPIKPAPTHWHHPHCSVRNAEKGSVVVGSCDMDCPRDYEGWGGR